MKDYLKFPEKNIVSKKISKHKFLNSANLTSNEKKILSSYLNEIDILYSFPFDDGEIIVLQAEITLLDENIQNNDNSDNNITYFGDTDSEINRAMHLDRLVEAISNSLPYMIFLIIKCEGVVKFFAFDSRTNRNDGSRKVICEKYASHNITLSLHDIFDKLFIDNIRAAIDVSNSAEQLYLNWCSILFRDSLNNNDMLGFEKSVIEYRKTLNCNTEIEELSNISVYYDENNYLQIIDVSETDEKFFVDFCAYHVKSLYIEACIDGYADYDESEWISRYIDACNEYAQDEFTKKLGTDSILYIRNMFVDSSNVIYINEDDINIFDVDKLKECIGEYYFKDYE